MVLGKRAVPTNGMFFRGMFFFGLHHGGGGGRGGPWFWPSVGKGSTIGEYISCLWCAVCCVFCNVTWVPLYFCLALLHMICMPMLCLYFIFCLVFWFCCVNKCFDVYFIVVCVFSVPITVHSQEACSMLFVMWALQYLVLSKSILFENIKNSRVHYTSDRNESHTILLGAFN